MARGRNADMDDDSEAARLNVGATSNRKADALSENASAVAYPTYKSVFKPLTSMAWPVLFTYLCNFAVPVISVSTLVFTRCVGIPANHVAGRCVLIRNSSRAWWQVIFVGHYGREEDLASIGLAVMFCNVSGM